MFLVLWSLKNTIKERKPIELTSNINFTPIRFVSQNDQNKNIKRTQNNY